MGEIIKKSAGADTIFGDVESALTRARAKGGRWAELAETRLAEPWRLIAMVVERLADAEKVLLPLQATLDATDDEVDRAVGRIADEIWNDIGRPASDATYSILFPGGIAAYTNVPDDEQPDQMELLAELLESGLHSKLPARNAKAYAKRVREQAALLRKASVAVVQPKARVRHLEGIKSAIAQHAQSELSNLKRLYKAENFSEAEIHSVIPDRSRKGTKRGPEPTPTPSPTPGPA